MSSEYPTETKILGYFLSGDTQTTLQIPHYQRGYSWKKDHVTEFFQDLYEHMNEEDAYYLGTITTIKHESKSGIEVHELIDGQQRLTTAIILLSCIRDKFHELEPSHVKYIDEEIFNTNVKGEEVYYKLILDEADDMFFRDSVLAKKPELGADKFKGVKTKYETQTNLKNAYRTIQKLIEEELNNQKSQNEQIEFLDKLRTTLRKRFLVSTLRVSNASKAYTLFNKMNDRGLKLVPADLAKDLILSLIHKENGGEAAKHAAKKWRNLEGRLLKNKPKINNYIHHYLVTFYPSVNKGGNKEFRYIQKTKDFDVLEKILNKKEKSSDKSEELTGTDFLDDLHKKLANYEVLVSYVLPSDNKDTEKSLKHEKISAAAKENIRWINELGIITVYPLLMAGLEKYKKEDFEKLSDILLKWFFRVKTIANRNASKLEKDLANITFRMMNDEPAPKGNLTVRDVENELRRLDIPDKVFESHLPELSLGIKPSKYFLAKIVERTEGKVTTDLMYPTSLEHIMPIEIEKPPRSEDEQKITWLEYIQKINGISKEDAQLFHEDYKGRIGNLTLISPQKNPSIGTDSFVEKCKAYKTSHIALTKDIAECEKWDRTEIEKRHNYLTEIAKEIWVI